MKFLPTQLKDAWLIEAEPHGDERGFFARTMCDREFAAMGMLADFVQMNMSYSARKGTLRGLHYQQAPFAEAKLIRCISGAIWDVIVDLRGGSDTYMKHQGFELSASNRRQLYVPPGFAHSFLTLEDEVEVLYPVTAHYTPAAESGLRFDDPALAIEWPLLITTVSDKDMGWPRLEPKQAPF